MAEEKNSQLKITVYGYDVVTTDEATKLVIEQLSKLGVAFGKLRPIRFPTKVERHTALISPHKHKRAQETFERKTHRRKIFISNVSQIDLKKLEKELKVPNTAHLELSFY